MEYDIFISHASEDKNSIATDLTTILVKIGCKVWYDEFSLKIGDGLSKSIDNGLLKSNFGLVILSKNFFSKKWTEYELRGLIVLDTGKNKKILPPLPQAIFRCRKPPGLWSTCKVANDACTDHQ